jgi:hypothetical protein
MLERKRPSITYLLVWTLVAALLAAAALTAGMRDVLPARAKFMYVISSVAVLACLYHWIVYLFTKKPGPPPEEPGSREFPQDN